MASRIPGKRLKDVGKTHDYAVGPLAEVAGYSPKDHAYRRPHRDPEHSDAEGVAAPVYDPAEDVATQLVCAEPVLTRWSLKLHAPCSPSRSGA